MGYLKANILFSDENSFCRYIENYKCTIYDNRPSICKVYPLSPNLDDNIYIDDSCPAVNTQVGQTIVKDGMVIDNFIYPTLENYQDKFIDTHLHLEKFNNIKNFEKIITIKNIDFYKYIKDTDDFYIRLHLESLKKLDNQIL